MWHSDKYLLGWPFFFSLQYFLSISRHTLSPWRWGGCPRSWGPLSLWFVPKEAQFWIKTEIFQACLKPVAWAELTGNTLQSKESSLALGHFSFYINFKHGFRRALSTKKVWCYWGKCSNMHTSDGLASCTNPRSSLQALLQEPQLPMLSPR